MATLDRFDLARIDFLAGFRGDALANMVAIQMSESGGNTDAHNTSGEDSRGISQINAPYHPQYDPAALFNPIYNAIAALQISGGGRDFSAWTTYTGGAYLANLAAARTAAIQASSEAETQGITTPATLASGVQLAGLGDWGDRFKNWIWNGPGPIPGPGALWGLGGDAAGATGDAIGGAFGGATGALGKIGDFFGMLTDPHRWARIGLTVAAVLVIGLGVVLFSHEKIGAWQENAQQKAATAAMAAG